MRLGRGSTVENPAPAPRHARPSPGPSDLSVNEGGTRLGERLVAAGYASERDVRAALDSLPDPTGRPLGRILADQGVVSDLELARTLAEQHGVSLIDLGSVTPSAEASALLDEATARELLALPVAVDGDAVRVAVADPTPDNVARLKAALGRRVMIAVAPQSDIEQVILSTYRALTSVDSHVRAFEARDQLRRDAARLEAVNVNDDAPVVRVVQMLIAQGLRDRASDIHIEPADDRIRVRYRVDGALTEVASLPDSIGPAVVSRIKILGGMNIVERRRPQDGQISMDIEGRAVDIRVSTTAVVGGEKVVMRLLDKSRPLYALSSLGMPEDTVEAYEALLRSPYGMVICAGPTGSGKTTTLYSSLTELNTPERNIMTIEDPVEYTFPTINQIQINEQAGITFANGLRSILRQDPDIILVGEVRDVETARIAVQSALTGHFVLSSLHATDASSALHRLLDMGIEPFLVASSVSAVVAQRLVRRICPHCRGPHEPSADELSFFRTYNGQRPMRGFSAGRGCNFCAHTGYLDRTGVYELMPITDEIRALIVERGSHDDLRKLCLAQGMRTLQAQSLRLVEANVTTISEVMRTIYAVGA